MKLKLFAFALFLTLSTAAQDISLALQKEPVMTAGEKTAAWAKVSGTVVGFGSSNLRYAQDRVPEGVSQTKTLLNAWKGEKVSAQLLVYGNKDIAQLKIQPVALKSASGATISKAQMSIGYLGYVITDEFKNGCGHRKSVDFDSSLVADPINHLVHQVRVSRHQVQPVWVSIEVPQHTPAGIYNGQLEVQADKKYTLQIQVKVANQILPPPAQWSFNLDFWQHPAAVARVHNVPLWSDKHFDWMRKYYTMLARAGQKNITASIVNEPWGHQTYDDFPSLIRWTKKKDGSWKYDYTLFDKYIAFVMSCGIKERINCYSMVPWKIAFQYFDENLGSNAVFTDKIGTPAYNAFWRPMLEDFTRHLKSKGWFNITTIAMDERPMAAMQSVIALLKEVDPKWKIALAGDYHPEIEADIYDYCIASKFKFPEATLALRKQQNKLSTWYTCCAEKYPNGFTFSPPAEHIWLGWYTAAQNMEGYLRWAYNSWTAAPLKDSRFITWPAGDTYQVYPGPMTSIRFEKLIEGIQDFEKITILRKQYQQANNTKALEQLEKALSVFEIEKLSQTSAADMVDAAKAAVFTP